MEEQVVVAAAIDCGSNSTRLLISEVSDGKIKKLFKTHNVTKTSEGLDNTLIISKESKKRLFRTLKTYINEIEKFKVDQVLCIGTAVFRDAQNSEEIIEEVKRKFDLDLKVVSGEEEGQLTSVGVLSDSNINDDFLIVDIGGRSTEFIYEEDKKINVISLNLGVVSISEIFIKENTIEANDEESTIKFINNNLDFLDDLSNKSIIGVAGTFTSLASIFLGQDKYDEEAIHLKSISLEWVESFYNKIKSMTESEIIVTFSSLDPKRAKTLKSGVLLIVCIMKKFKINELKVSKSDILEGLILKNY